MSPADAATRITRATITLGTAEGVGAMSLQAIARTAGVSKALLLYHFAGKSSLLRAAVERLGETSAARLRRAAEGPDALEAWRALARDEAARGELALLAALSLETDLDAATLATARTAREDAASTLAVAMLAGVRLSPKVPAVLLGRLILRQLDGVAPITARGGMTREDLESELDAFALALLALGR